MEIEDLRQRHPNCPKDRCQVCMDDHWQLMEFYREKTGVVGEDHLGKFRTMLDRRGIPGETEYGWATEHWWNSELIQEYIDSWFDEGTAEDTYMSTVTDHPK